MTVTVRIKDYYGETTIKCDQNPLAEKAMCWACLNKCVAFHKLKQEVEEEHQKRLQALIEKYSQIGEIIEWGRLACLDCPEKPRECMYCRNHPTMFEQFKKPYIKLLIKE